MIKIENTDVYGWEAAIRGARNPMNSWDKSDSAYCEKHITDREACKNCPVFHADDLYCDSIYIIGPNDKKLLQSLASAGPDHGKFLRFITVSLDITAPLYWWKEFDTYKVGTVANSCSTMHKIHAKEFELDDFSHEHLATSHTDSFPLAGIYKGIITSPLGMLHNTIDVLNVARDRYLETKDKSYWWQMIQLLPTSYNQRRTVLLNYQVLKSMYHARKHHKLDEWRDFCDWIQTLPYSELITDG